MGAQLKADLAAHGGFEDIAQVEAFVGGWQAMQNSRPLEDFEGLSPEQMAMLLDAPFESPAILEFRFEHYDPTGAPVMQLFTALAEHIGEQGVKPTATGNLPPAICRTIAQDYWGARRYSEETAFTAIRSEPDFAELHKTRALAELAGLIRKYKGRLILSRLARTHLQQSDFAGLYRILLQTYCTTFNWAYEDLYPDLMIIQDAFAFTLYLLHRHGQHPYPEHFYASAFLRAFPMIVEEVPEEDPFKPEDQVRHAYALRTLERGLPFLGLLERTAAGKSADGRRTFLVQSTPLLRQLVQFHV
ncbi:hypothetical protein QQM79_20025 [Marinobacteraceae bacterium S3BR75-40.1]